MSTLSANTLFHFTKKKYLLSILGSSFLPRYSKEFDPALNDGGYLIGPHVYIPMVSFCDIPMSMVRDHTKIYNTYGIGLNKDWGIAQHLNPVFYVQNKSVILANLVSAIHSLTIQNFESNLGKITVSDNEILDQLLDLYSYLKPYICGGKCRGRYKNYKYYNEKEWRYIPTIPFEKKYLRRKFNDLTSIELVELNNEVASFPLTFTGYDINYIIIKTTKEIDQIMRLLEVYKRYSKEEVEYIRTTFILEKRIFEDF